MSLLLIGLNHKTAPVAFREKLAQQCGRPIPGADGAGLEVITVFTCNRAEFYFAGAAAAAERAFGEWLRHATEKPDEFEPFLYRLSGDEAVRHLLMVSSGLDSMVVGENQILGQLKTSYQACVSEGSVGKRLHSLFQKALEVGKRVRTETAISENTVSIASTAVDLAIRIFGPLSGSKALVIGAGEMASLVARHLTGRGVKELICVNRTFERAVEMAEAFNGCARQFSDLPTLLAEVDIVISSTGASRPILLRPMLEEAMARRPDRPEFLIDIAVPRDVEPECGEIENVFLYDIDDLQGVVDENIGVRMVEAQKAQAIVNWEVNRFHHTVETFTVVPLIKALREKSEELAKQEMDKFRSRNRDLSPEIEAEIGHLARILLAKWLHAPLVALKELGTADQKELDLIARIFDLPAEALPTAPLFGLPDQSGAKTCVDSRLGKESRAGIVQEPGGKKEKTG